ncbi:erythromycin esterase family protein [Alkalihalobacterium chitinilyticum]|uniref:Erythromycin esterase family protein n=1 Tax=Alkalihalobacterium chitinilyticum TaxID=2980103 RepID=A0ABT5VCR5_9BACI|nr:erythromycin esterase family protein [Alkalihalobacterium chitinilyticum]MDE5413245.1 erythromycin esterase family protein [Alkalihalobacterium chitinilyticum]
MITTRELTDHIKKHAVPFNKTADLQPLIQKAGQAKYALLGESSHGTREFYTIRADITKQLIQEHQFSFIAVEGDWPACYEVNRYIKGRAPEYSSAEDVLKKSFYRWPSWMWANREMVDLIQWLHAYNQQQTDRKIGFYGIDVYSLWESMEAIVDYLKKIKSPDLDKALQAIECFEPYHRKPENYGISAAFYGEDCMSEVMELLSTIKENKKMYDQDPEAVLNMNINAIAAMNAEHYYHTMVTNDNESWNIRDRHMVEALQHISEFHGSSAKGIIWEHNTHIGDARATDMAKEGMVNVGQLTRESFGANHVYAVGFGTYEGTVIAGTEWGSPAEIMTVPQGVTGSWEEALHQAGAYNQFLLFTDDNKDLFSNVIGHRAIGVVYHPEFEHHGNYVPSRLSQRYDAFIHIDKTTALSPL